MNVKSKFDMHCHVQGGSVDAGIPLERYAGILMEKGFDGMLVTDHDSFKGYDDFVKRFGGNVMRFEVRHDPSEIPGKAGIDAYDGKDGIGSSDGEDGIDASDGKAGAQTYEKEFVILRGVEYDTINAGHFIVIMPDGVEPMFLTIRGMNVNMLINAVHQLGGILGPAHPYGARSSSAMFCFKMRHDPSIVSKCDFLEGFNTCEPYKANERARVLARKYNIQCTGGSDSHRERHVGSAFTVFDRPIRCNNDLIACIKEHGIETFGGRERDFKFFHVFRNAPFMTYPFKIYNAGISILRAHTRRRLVDDFFSFVSMRAFKDADALSGRAERYGDSDRPRRCAAGEADDRPHECKPVHCKIVDRAVTRESK